MRFRDAHGIGRPLQRLSAFSAIRAGFESLGFRAELLARGVRLCALGLLPRTRHGYTAHIPARDPVTRGPSRGTVRLAGAHSNKSLKTRVRTRDSTLPESMVYLCSGMARADSLLIVILLSPLHTSVQGVLRASVHPQQANEPAPDPGSGSVSGGLWLGSWRAIVGPPPTPVPGSVAGSPRNPRCKTWSAEYPESISHIPDPATRLPGRVWFYAPNQFRWELTGPATPSAVRSRNRCS